MTNLTPAPSHTSSSDPNSTDPMGPSGEQAREALRRADAAGIDRAQDRSVHALATAGFRRADRRLLRAEPHRVALDRGRDRGVLRHRRDAGRWQARAARSSPKGTRSAGRWGLGLTLVAIIVALGVVNSAYRDGRVPSWALAAAGLCVAAPLLVAVAVIRRGAR